MRLTQCGGYKTILWRTGEDAMHVLHVETHYLNCPDSTGRLPRREDQTESDRNHRHPD